MPTNTEVTLVPIDPDGTPRGWMGPVPEVAIEALRATSAPYTTVGFREPWIGDLAVAGDTPIGMCGFESPPQDGRVEIAYFTFPEFEERGFASVTAARLVAVAREHRPPSWRRRRFRGATPRTGFSKSSGSGTLESSTIPRTVWSGSGNRADGGATWTTTSTHSLGSS